MMHSLDVVYFCAIRILQGRKVIFFASRPVQEVLMRQFTWTHLVFPNGKSSITVASCTSKIGTFFFFCLSNTISSRIKLILVLMINYKRGVNFELRRH